MLTKLYDWIVRFKRPYVVDEGGLDELGAAFLGWLMADERISVMLAENWKRAVEDYGNREASRERAK